VRFLWIVSSVARGCSCALNRCQVITLQRPIGMGKFLGKKSQRAKTMIAVEFTVEVPADRARQCSRPPPLPRDCAEIGFDSWKCDAWTCTRQAPDSNAGWKARPGLKVYWVRFAPFQPAFTRQGPLARSEDVFARVHIRIGGAARGEVLQTAPSVDRRAFQLPQPPTIAARDLPV
jgi:hypothetical protein